MLDRKQITRIRNLSSTPETVAYGIPQCSILGPTLFTIYINDIMQVLPSCKELEVICYADDTVLIFRDKSWDRVFTRTQVGVQKITSWLDMNLLTLNTSKTKFICFYKNKSARPNFERMVIHTCGGVSVATALVPNCSCDEIERVDSVKYLGLTVDETLSFKKHIQGVTGRVRGLTRVMKILRNSAAGSILNLVYLSLCQSLVTYCITAWGGAVRSAMMCLERAQRSILKVMYRKHFRYPTIKLYRDSEVLTVRQLYILKVVLRRHRMNIVSGMDEVQPSDKRRIQMATVRTRTAFAQRFGSFALPYLYKKCNKHLKLVDKSMVESKAALIQWLSSLDYETTEAFLTVPV